METVIKSHNKTVLNPQPQDQIAGYNCRNPASCPLRGNYLATGLIYSANVHNSAKSTKGRFKKRYDKHNYDFRHRAQRKATELSKLIWDLKDANTEYTIIWDIVTKAQPYVGGSKRCNLCLSAKLAIGNDKLSFGNRFEVQAYE